MKKQNSFKQTIQSYLDKRAKSDELFAVAYRKKNKSIDECLAYIMGEALKESSTISSGVKGCGMDNDIVFGMAVHYYDEDDIKVNKQTNYKVSAVSVKKEAATELLETKKPASSPNKRKGKKTEIPLGQFLLFEDLRNRKQSYNSR